MISHAALKRTTSRCSSPGNRWGHRDATAILIAYRQGGTVKFLPLAKGHLWRVVRLSPQHNGLTRTGHGLAAVRNCNPAGVSSGPLSVGEEGAILQIGDASAIASMRIWCWIIAVTAYLPGDATNYRVSVLRWRRHAASLSSEQAWEDWPPQSACDSGASRSKSMGNRRQSAKLVLASMSRQMERRS